MLLLSEHLHVHEGNPWPPPRHPRSRAPSRRLPAVAARPPLGTRVLAGCSGTPTDDAPDRAAGRAASREPVPPTPRRPRVRPAPGSPATVRPPAARRRPAVTLTAADGDVREGAVTFGKRAAPSAARSPRTAPPGPPTQRLEPGLRYRVRSVAVDADGLRTKHGHVPHRRPDPRPADLPEHRAVRRRDRRRRHAGHRAVRRRRQRQGLHREAPDRAVHPAAGGRLALDQRQRGALAPRSYWQPGTQVTVDADINSVPAGSGIYGQLSRSTASLSATPS